MPIRVAVIEDQDEIRNGYVYLINQSPEFKCFGYADAEQALVFTEKDKPDVMLMDVNLPGMSGIECTQRLKVRYPGLLIMMFTVYENNENIFNALEAGASGYILKQTPPAELIAAIKDVFNGGSPMSSQIARKVVASFNRINYEREAEFQLSEREREVIELLATGFRYQDIADKLFVSISTVRSHIYSIYEKLHVNNRTAALNKFNNRK